MHRVVVSLPPEDDGRHTGLFEKSPVRVGMASRIRNIIYDRRIAVGQPALYTPEIRPSQINGDHIAK